MPGIFRFAAAALFAASMCASAAAADFAQTARAGIAAAKIPANHLAIFVAPADLRATLFAHNSERALAPASAIKIATGFAALALLGPDFKWRTQWLADGALEGSTLRGDLIFRGGGDPLVTVDRFLKMILDLRASGIETIDGDFVVDDSFFAPPPHDPAAFDGAGLRPYNVGGGAAAVNFKTHRVVIFPRGGKIAARLDPPSDKVKLVNRLRPRKRRCRSWRSGFREIVKTRADGSVELSLVGGYPPRCGENGFYFAPPLSHADYVGGVFTALWRRLGGAFAPGGGAVKIGARAEARVVAEYESPPLSDAVKQMNKFSNNFIARNIFLSLPIGAGAPPPYTLTAARRTAADFVAARAGEDVFIDNGSGLSRKTKISAGALARLLRAAAAHPLRAEIASSLPIAGIDGTMKKRLRRGVAGAARLKGGTLNGVSALAGFAVDESGGEWIFVVMANDRRARRARALQDTLLRALYRGGGEEAAALLARRRE